MIVANASYKGGVGKSTVTAALASALALQGQRVLVADVDQNETLKQWSRDFELPACLRVEAVKPEALTAFVRGEAESGAWDHVLIDLMGAREERHLAAYALADLVVIPSQASKPDLREALRVRADIKRMEQATGMEIPYRLLLTKMRGVRTRVGAEVYRQLELVGMPTFRTVLVEREAYRQMFFCGVMPTEGVEGRKAGLEVRKLLAEIKVAVDPVRYEEMMREAG